MNGQETNWQALYSEAYKRQTERIRQIELDGEEAPEEEYLRLFELEIGMKGESL